MKETIIVVWSYLAVIVTIITLSTTLVLLRKARLTYMFIGLKGELIFWLICLGVLITLNNRLLDGQLLYIVICYTSLRNLTLISGLIGNPEKNNRSLECVAIRRRDKPNRKRKEKDR